MRPPEMKQILKIVKMSIIRTTTIPASFPSFLKLPVLHKTLKIQKLIFTIPKIHIINKITPIKPLIKTQIKPPIRTSIKTPFKTLIKIILANNPINNTTVPTHKVQTPRDPVHFLLPLIHSLIIHIHNIINTRTLIPLRIRQTYPAIPPRVRLLRRPQKMGLC